MTKRDMPESKNGFTLVEALVATAVFALIMSALYQGLGTGWRGLKASGVEDAALAALTAHLASSGIETPLAASSATGTTSGGIAWQTDIRPYDGRNTTPENKLRGSYDGYWVSVTVRWRTGRFTPEQSLTATTLKIKRAS